jgi:murein DD-endopeptidase MepM/ murein hydrolase activator NlpD
LAVLRLETVLLNPTVGAQRVLERLRLGPDSRSALAGDVHRRSLAAARSITTRLASGTLLRPHVPTVALRGVRRTLNRRLGAERGLPVAVAAIVLAASVLSFLPDAAGGIGGPQGDGPAPRVAIAGAFSDPEALFEEMGSSGGPVRYGGLRPIDPAAFALEEEPEEPVADLMGGSFLDDGTLLKPLAVNTSVADGSGLLRTYKVRSGDTLVAIARAHGVSMMTVWWANKLTSKADLKVGQVLTIPTVNGLVARVEEGDTLESLAAHHGVAADDIYTVNGLEDRALVIGQTLVIPGAVGEAIPTPAPTPTRTPTRAPTRSTSGTVTAPSTYSGGVFAWPVVGGNNYISQYFHYGHYALDIAATYGSTVRSAAAGTVIFAGWKSNGGGYQVWISHGSNLYTTYNHLSAVTVGRGQQVAKGQQVGRIGSSGRSTGPHLHFEVWRGPVWDGGRRVNPLLYY